MYIIFGEDNAKQMRDRYIVLELETLPIDGKVQTAYCVLPPETIALGALPDIERLTRLHQALADAIKRGDMSTVEQGLEHLKGKLGADMDSFYDVIEARIKTGTLDVTPTNA